MTYQVLTKLCLFFIFIFCSLPSYSTETFDGLIIIDDAMPIYISTMTESTSVFFREEHVNKPIIPFSRVLVVEPVEVNGEWLYRITEAPTLEVATLRSTEKTLYAVEIFKMHIAYRSDILDKTTFICDFPMGSEGIMWGTDNPSWKNRIQKWLEGRL